MQDIILQVSKFELFSILGGISVPIIGISVWLSSLVFERMKQSWQKAATIELEVMRKQGNVDIEQLKKTINIELENVRKQGNIDLEYFKKVSNKEIEDLKGEIAKNNSIINTLLGQQGQSYQKILDKKIDAAQKAWNGILQLKATMPPIVALAYDIFVDGEFAKGILDEDRGMGPWGDAIVKIDMQEFINNQDPIVKDIRQLRPFLPAKISMLLYIYGAVIGRLVFTLTDSYKKGEPKEWREDNGLKQILDNVLNVDEIDYI